MRPLCTADAFEYVLGAHNGPGLYQNGYGGNSPSEVCRNFAYVNGGLMTNVTDHFCVASFSTVSFPIFSACRPSDSFRATSEDYAALSTIFGVILVAATLIWGAKQVLNLLRNRPEA